MIRKSWTLEAGQLVCRWSAAEERTHSTPARDGGGRDSRGRDSAAEVLDVRNGGSTVDREGDVTMRLWRWMLARWPSWFGSDGVLLADVTAKREGCEMAYTTVNRYAGPTGAANNQLYSIRIGPFSNREQAAVIAERLRTEGWPSTSVVSDPGFLVVSEPLPRGVVHDVRATLANDARQMVCRWSAAEEHVDRTPSSSRLTSSKAPSSKGAPQTAFPGVAAPAKDSRRNSASSPVAGGSDGHG